MFPVHLLLCTNCVRSFCNAVRGPLLSRPLCVEYHQDREAEFVQSYKVRMPRTEENHYQDSETPGAPEEL